MSGVGRFIRKRRAKRAAFMADPAIIKRESISSLLGRVRDLAQGGSFSTQGGRSDCTH